MHFARENVPAWEIEGIKFTILILDLDRLNLVFVFQIIFFFGEVNRREINILILNWPSSLHIEMRIENWYFSFFVIYTNWKVDLHVAFPLQSFDYFYYDYYLHSLNWTIRREIKNYRTNRFILEEKVNE